MSMGWDEGEEIWLEQETAGNLVCEALKRMRDSGILCDVQLLTLDSDGKEATLSAHKVVLAASIPFFRGMFTGGMAEANQAKVQLKTIRAEDLEQLVSYAYSGRLRITTGNAQALMEAANFLQIQPVFEASATFIGKRLDESNALTLWTLAFTLGADSPLLKAADRFLSMHFLSLSKTDEFRSLDHKNLLGILEKDSLHVEKEEQVFDAVMRWVETDKDARVPHLSKVLAKVRLHLLRPDFLVDAVVGNPLIRADDGCQDLIKEASAYHQMPEPRSLLQRCRTPLLQPRCRNDGPGLIYAVGHVHNSHASVEIYDPMLDRWFPIEAMSTRRQYAKVAVMHGFLYVIGGTIGGLEALGTVEVFNPETQSWREVVSLNVKRFECAVAVCNHRLYVCGGSENAFRARLASVEVLDPEKNEWTMAQPMSRQRRFPGIAVLHGQIYVIGGLCDGAALNTVERMDPETGAWMPVKSMRSPRYKLGACALNGKIYVCGGAYDNCQSLDTSEMYDPVTDTWTSMGSMNVKRGDVSLVASYDRLFAIGGYGPSHLDSMETFDEASNSWSFVAPMLTHKGPVAVGVVPVFPKPHI